LKSLYSGRYRKLLSLLIEARKSGGLSQRTVADRLGRPQSFVSKYENGERRLDVIEFLRLSEVIGFDYGEMLKSLSSLAGQRRRSR
jgi:transcriptional regulator with XRE-family HTH domain